MPDKLRLIVMTDISSLEAAVGEPDDTQSLVRLLLYANEFDIEGLIATWTKHGDTVRPEYIRAIVQAYGEVRDNLLLHHPDYPPASQLLGCTKAGHPDGNHFGPDLDTEASEWVLEVLDRPDPRPVWVIFWGGPRELAQALWKAQQTRAPEQVASLVARLRVYSISDQDATAAWIQEQFPDLFYVVPKHVFRGMYKDGDASLVSPEWVEEHIRNGHGPLGAAYPNYQGGDPWGRVRGIKEGDTPSYLYLIPNGLGDPMQPTWGSWGGRMAGSGNRYSDAEDTLGGDTSPRVTVYRWRPAYQAGFQARLDWCVQPYAQANHEPVAVLAGARERTVRPGERVHLSAAGSRDPDGDALRYHWALYPEASDYHQPLEVSGANTPEASLIAPAVETPTTLHLILTVTDEGTPPLSSYQRVLIHIQP